VNIQFVKKLKDSITAQFKLNEESGANLRKMILSSVASELTALLTVDKPVFKPKKGKANVVMFVGL
jgi:signal recognition particle subunit SRP54